MSLLQLLSPAADILVVTGNQLQLAETRVNDDYHYQRSNLISRGDASVFRLLPGHKFALAGLPTEIRFNLVAHTTNTTLHRWPLLACVPRACNLRKIAAIPKPLVSLQALARTRAVCAQIVLIR